MFQTDIPPTYRGLFILIENFLIVHSLKNYRLGKSNKRNTIFHTFAPYISSSIMTLIFASNNKHKIQEIKALLPDSFTIKSLENIGCTEDIPETADTIEGNAMLKANYVSEKYKLPCFADDSGPEVEVLDGAAGVYSARYAGEQRNDNDNIEKLLNVLEDKTNRKAQFKTVIALNLNGEQHLFTGIIKGEIISEKRGT